MYNQLSQSLDRSLHLNYWVCPQKTLFLGLGQNWEHDVNKMKANKKQYCLKFQDHIHIFIQNLHTQQYCVYIVELLLPLCSFLGFKLLLTHITYFKLIDRLQFVIIKRGNIPYPTLINDFYPIFFIYTAHLNNSSTIFDITYVFPEYFKQRILFILYQWHAVKMLDKCQRYRLHDYAENISSYLSHKSFCCIFISQFTSVTNRKACC